VHRNLSRLLLAITCVGLLTVGASLTPGYAADDPIVIGSTNFPEQLVLAHIYADVLEARDIAVETRLNLGSREIVFPALKAGEIDVLPEYTGALLAYLTGGDATASKPQAMAAALQKALPDGIVRLQPAQAQDKDALVVTQATADKYNLRTISDLQGAAADMIIGGPPELKIRADGLPGLKKTYGLTFKQFRSLDAGGPLTVAALKSGDIDIARMFSTQGIIDANGWIILQDDKNLVPAQNIVAVVREDKLTDRIQQALDQVAAKLTTADLQKLNNKVGVQKQSPAKVATQWVTANGLAGGQ